VANYLKGKNMKTTLEELRVNVLNMTIYNCQNDTNYNDNTLHDLILFGFKGLANMGRDELERELNDLKQWEGV
jgi:hypothetical protein